MEARTHLRTRLLRRGLALALGGLVAVVGAELAYRWTRVAALSPTTNPKYVAHDDELGWKYLPGARERHASAEFDVEVAINARGFRGPEWLIEKRGTRVLVLGDSFAFGWGVRYEDSFTGRLAAAHTDWEVLGAAVSGYGTDQELLLARKLVPETKPDVVVCVFCSNDLWESSSDVAYGKSKPRFVERGAGLELENVPVPDPWLDRTSTLWRAWKKKRWEHAFEERARDVEAEWRVVLALYRALRDELASDRMDATGSPGTRAVPLIVVSSEDRLAEFASTTTGVAHVDVRPVLAASREPTSFPVDGHWNAQGHALVARALDAAIERALSTRR
ncbi:MAG: SGNH/GDSL hydrolase family protein [Planctomycetes bacterium]|nr:SGNH/GDSL hydrolase family protein [Planctomycetota bacterium]